MFFTEMPGRGPFRRNLSQGDCHVVSFADRNPGYTFTDCLSDTVPKSDIVRECGFEGETTENFSQCSKDEVAALARLKTRWTQFVGADKSTCIPEATIGGFTSYVELLTCLEMARDARSERQGCRDAASCPLPRH